MTDFVSQLVRLVFFLFSYTDNVIVFVPLFCIVFCTAFAIVSALIHRDFGMFLK